MHVFPNSIFDLLTTLLVGHPFGGSKCIIWLALMHAFSELFGANETVSLFRNSASTFMCCLGTVLTSVYNWCKFESSFTSYSLSFLLSNWKDFLYSPLGIGFSLFNDVFLSPRKCVHAC